VIAIAALQVLPAGREELQKDFQRAIRRLERNGLTD
jgi:hypothetical protein